MAAMYSSRDLVVYNGRMKTWDVTQGRLYLNAVISFVNYQALPTYLLS